MAWASDEAVRRIDARIDRLRPQLRRFLRGFCDLDEADIIQQVRIGYATHETNPGNVRSLDAWVATSVRNAANQVRRRERRHIHSELERCSERFQVPPASAAEHAELHHAVFTRLERVLNSCQQQIILARLIQGESLANYAERNGETFEACHSRLKRARKRLEADPELRSLAIEWLGCSVQM